MRVWSAFPPPDMPEAEREQMARKHIFAVNSSPEFLDVLRQLLQEERYNVTTTNFLPRTFEQIQALSPDLLIVDIAVGQGAGWDLLERLHVREVTDGIPVIVTSTDPKLLDKAQADPSRFGGKRFLAKPMVIDELLETIESLIGRSEADTSRA